MSKEQEKEEIKNEVVKDEAEEQLESTLSELDLARKELEETRCLIEEHKKLLKQFPARDAKEAELCEKQISRNTKQSAGAKKIERQKAYDNQMVTGKFLNIRAPGNSVKLTYIKYADDVPKWYTFEHNKTYTIKRGFADQINEYYARIQHVQKVNNVIVDEHNPGTALEEQVIRHQSYAFVPVGFEKAA